MSLSSANTLGGLVVSVPQEHGVRTKANVVALSGEEYISLTGVATFVSWVVLLTGGLLGFWLSYGMPEPRVESVPPIQAEIVPVEMRPEAPPLEERRSVVFANLEPPPLALPALPPIEPPPLIAVAAPSPSIAFSVPLEGPVRIVDEREAAYRQAEAPATVAPSQGVPEVLTFGRGAGKQPAPEYPLRAVREGQEGTVKLQFAVAETGRVLRAEVVSPSPWPLLNEAAVRAVYNRWRFEPGLTRLYQIAIHFQLEK